MTFQKEFVIIVNWVQCMYEKYNISRKFRKIYKYIGVVLLIYFLLSLFITAICLFIVAICILYS